MDQATRNKLRSVVTQCRRLLEESVAQQLQGRYDIYATGKKDEVRAEKDVPLGHLSDEERQARHDILAHFEHVKALGYKPTEALEQLIREIAFTHLNRLCAYKMMEVRDVYVGGQRFREAVSKGLKSQGFLFYLADHAEDEQRFNAGQQEEAYRHFLNWLGGTLSQEIGVLFSPTDPANRVYPPQRVLDEVLDLLNSEELKEIWSEDETIGWVYQYFTPKELRDQARKESSAPRNSYELAFRNQFFTPRYVVEFLTDNTLGRIWYEMRKGNTRLVDECLYMVRRPTEVFLRDPDRPLATPSRAEWVKAAARGDFSLMPEEPTSDELADFSLIHDGYELARQLGHDDPYDLAQPWLDLEDDKSDLPTSSAELWVILFGFQRRWGRAGGPLGGEFFDQWKTVYRAFRDRILASDLSQGELLRQAVYIPHRSKKDPREIKILDPACGSGHFLLYCFALLLLIYEEAYDDPDLGPGLQADYPTRDDLRKGVPGLILRHNLHGIDIDLRCTQIAALALWLRCQRAYQEMGLKKERPRITRSNIVCAEPMPGEERMLKEFMAQVEPKLLGQLVEVVFAKMKLAGEAGSLLKIEDEIRDAVAEARHRWRIGPSARQMRLFELKPVERQEKFDLSGVTAAEFFEQAEAKVIETLRLHFEQTRNGDRLQRRLFADDAVQGFAFVDICHKTFNVILMNPPFGEPTDRTRRYVVEKISEGRNDLYTALVARCYKLLDPQDSMLGAITSRAFLLGRDHRDFRSLLLSSTTAKLSVLWDLGGGVLDGALVETAAYTVSASTSGYMLYVDSRAVNRDDLPDQMPNDLSRFLTEPLGKFRQLPDSQFIFGESGEAFMTVGSGRTFDDEADVTYGLITENDERFLRLKWEVDPRELERTWFPFSKGGDYSWWSSDVHLVVNRRNDGEELAAYAAQHSGNVARTRASSKFYGRPAAVYSRRSQKGFSVRRLRRGCCFGDKSGVIFPRHGAGKWLSLLPFLLASTKYIELLEAQVKFGSYEIGAVKRLPWPKAFGSSVKIVAADVYAALDSLDTFDETTSQFLHQKPGGYNCIEVTERVLSIVGKALEGEGLPISPEVETHQRSLAAERHVELTSPSSFISYLVGLAFGRWDVRVSLAPASTEPVRDPFDAAPLCPPGMLKDSTGLPAQHPPSDYPIAVRWDGILVDDPDHTDDIIRRVRDVLEVIWKVRADAIEQEACEILGVSELRDYFRKPGAGGFWDNHIKRYSKSRRKAPIYWLLQSSKKNYALWIYYHRLDKDILFKALLNYVEPKLRKEDARLDELRTQKTALGPAAKGTKKLDKDIERQEAFLSELRDFEDKLRRVASLHVDPDLNDGVVLNIAPLHELVPWKEAKSYWDDLMDGKYEWSSIGRQLREKGLLD